MSKTFNTVLFFLLIIGSFTSCNSNVNTNNKLVVCTTNIIGDVTRELLPEDIKVINLMGAGVDPHLYKAGQKDLEYLQNAFLIVENGLHLEGKMSEILSKLERYKKVVKMSDGVPNEKLIKLDDHIYDPHIWFDVNLWKQGCAHLKDELITAFPNHKNQIISNYIHYENRLDSLNTFVKSKMLTIDSNQRVLVTAHDAFSYFGQAYHTEVKGLQGISTQSDYGLKDVSELVNFLVSRQIPAVFVETSVSKKSIQSVVEGCNKRGHNIVIGGQLYSDALGGENESGNNYINMVGYNVETITNALNK